MGISRVLSLHANIPYGVTQGSILGPLLFLIYVNDMCRAVSNKRMLHADDSAILFADTYTSNIEAFLKNELVIVSDWLIDNTIYLYEGHLESSKHGLLSP